MYIINPSESNEYFQPFFSFTSLKKKRKEEEKKHKFQFS